MNLPMDKLLRSCWDITFADSPQPQLLCLSEKLKKKQLKLQLTELLRIFETINQSTIILV